MIRPFTLVSALLFVGSGLYLYQTKHQAQLLDRQIRHIMEATEATRARSGVLRAEYALLNDPDRLAELAADHLPALRATLPAQWSTMADLDRRLPAVGASGDAPGPLEPEAAPMVRVEPPPAREPVPVGRGESVPMTPEAPPPAQHPAAVAVAAPAARPTPRVAAISRPADSAQQAALAPPRPPVLRPASPPSLPAQVNPAHGAQEPLVPPPPPQILPPQILASGSPGLAALPHPSRPQAAVLLPRVAPPPASAVRAPATTTPVFAATATVNRPEPRQLPYVVPNITPNYAAPPATTAEAIARIARGGPVDRSSPLVASALGMARTMTLGSPVSSASAATLYPQSPAR